MTRRRWFLLGCAGLCLLGSGVTFVWAARPGPLGSAFRQIQLGMSEAEVARLLPDAMEPRFGGSTFGESGEWEGRIAGRPKSIHIEEDLDNRLALKETLICRLFDECRSKVTEENEKHERIEFWDEEADKCVATARVWSSGTETLIILFDGTGIIEKAHLQSRVRPNLGERLDEWKAWIWDEPNGLILP